MDVTFTVQVLGSKNNFHQHYSLTQTPKTMTLGQDSKFGYGYGWPQFCEVQHILKEPKNQIQCNITVSKLTEKQGVNEITTRPAGEQEIICNATQK